MDLKIPIGFNRGDEKMKTDRELQRDVMEALRWEPLLTSTDIGVTARNGIITLTGIVNSYPKKLAAERAAKHTQGVRAVAEEIEIRIDGIHYKSDSDIAAAAVDALRWCSSVPDDKIKISVESGWVKLEGEVEWQ